MAAPLAYLILAHADPTNCGRLAARILEDEDASIFIHIDRKSSEDFSKVFALCPKRIHRVEKNHKIYWSGFSMVRATLATLEQATATGAFQYYVLLSGADYPLRPAREIRDHLFSRPYRQHINRINALESPEAYLKLLRHYQFRDAWLPFTRPDKVVRKLATMLAYPFPHRMPDIIPCVGSQWWALTDDCVRFILKFADQHPELERFYRHTWAPDEHFFQTIVHNSHFVEEASPLIPYQGRGMWRMANLHLIHPSLSKTYTLEDFEEVVNSDRFFVRKVSTSQSSALLDKIDAAIDKSPI